MSQILVDTQVVLWWLQDDRRLTERGRTRLTSAQLVAVSAASTWEVAIKTNIGKLSLDLPDGASFADHCAAVGFRLVDVTHDDAWAVSQFHGQAQTPSTA